MLGREREAEPGTRSASRPQPGVAAREPTEDRFPFFGGHTGAAVVEADAHTVVVAGLDEHGGRATRIAVSVLDDVAHDLREAPPVGDDLRRRAGDECHRRPGRAVQLEHPREEMPEVDRLVQQRRGAGVDARDLQQLEHHSLEQLDLLGQHRESFDNLRRKLVAAAVDDLDRRRDRGER